MRLLKLLALGGGGIVVVGALVVGVFLARGSATVEVTNVDCGTIVVPSDVVGDLARQLPVLELPSGPIEPGTTVTVRIPAGTYEVELTSDRIRVHWLAVTLDQPLPEPARSVVFEGRELVGAGVVRFDLEAGSVYPLRLNCGD
jgi:hypothetical protein